MDELIGTICLIFVAVAAMTFLRLVSEARRRAVAEHRARTHYERLQREFELRRQQQIVPVVSGDAFEESDTTAATVSAGP